MLMLNRIISIIFILVCVFLTAVVLFHEGNEQGLGSIGGIADTYWGKNRGRSVEGLLEKLTKVAAALFLILSLVLNIVK